jgi:hypothetical protein
MQYVRTPVYVQQNYSGEEVHKTFSLNTNLQIQLQGVRQPQSSMLAHGTPYLLGFPNPVLTFASQAVLGSTEAHYM